MAEENLILTRYKVKIYITTTMKINVLYIPSLYLSIRISPVCWYCLIDFKLIRKVPSGISSVSLISDTISCWYVDFCVVSWFPLKGNLYSVSATMSYSPLIYSISGPYYSIISIHINTLSVLKLLHVMFLLLVYILIFWPSDIVLNSFRVSTILSSSSSVTVYYFGASVSFLM